MAQEAKGIAAALVEWLNDDGRVAIIPYDKNGNTPVDPVPRFFAPPKSNFSVALLNDHEIEINLTADPFEIGHAEMPDPSIKTVGVFLGKQDMTADTILDPINPVAVESFLAAVAAHESHIDIPENHIYRLKKITIPLRTKHPLP